MSWTYALLLSFLLAACSQSAPSPETAEGESGSGEAASDQAEASGEAAAPGEAQSAEAAAAIAAEATRDPMTAPGDVAATPPYAEATESGLASFVLQAGTGTAPPAAQDTVTVHYTGWTTDGEMFDSSVQRGEPTSFPLNRVIAGWTEGLQLMVEGEKRRFWIPVELAYDNRPGRPLGMLIFDVELISIARAPEAPAAPENVAAAPENAEVTASGLASVVLQPGTGSVHPTAESEVSVHYSGWTTDGEMFDSSVTRGAPATFPLGGVIPGWTEGVQLMVEGEKRRFWIPVELAYNGRPGAPAGMLIFDVELLQIRN
ncbi:MAG: FKBP-type peptidyl-prolyl cis-trans isomerase [Bradymonadia bacterium]|jgi:FKBP-type peptidyl-prolyl cis-trans isomerase